MTVKLSTILQLCLALSVCLLSVAAHKSAPQDLCALPPDFILGASSGAYQIEGGWNEGGRGESIWDRAVHEKNEKIADGATGDVTCDSFHKYKTDVQMIKDLGFNAYRISLSWTRILPNGTLDNVNKEGIQYYSSLIDEMIQNGITPVVTIYHWDMPWRLQKLGGWTNSFIIDYFEDYANLAIASFGDRVKLWVTVNDPHLICESGYSNNLTPPFYNMTGVAGYLCNHNLLLAHARVYRMYKKKFATQNGKMGISIHSPWFEPESRRRKKDREASERALEFNLGLSANPIFGKKGNYPSAVRDRVDYLSRYVEGLTRSRLPTYTIEQILLIKGSADFLGLNHYSSQMITHGPPKKQKVVPSYEEDSYYQAYSEPTWEGDFENYKNMPRGFRNLLRWVKEQYGNPAVLVTENGIPDANNLLNDDLRIRYHSGYMKEMLKSIYEDGCNVFGYLTRSLMDSFEWNEGYKLKFGLYHVNFNDPSRPRTPKKSAQWFKNVASNWRIED